ncbi:hypothetical protein [Rugamonas sp.]|uniref:hypothetical protein n=1 Tax=Rugamonas sp. TaxID=1926287 RepID=UPI0025CBCF01|nr:hypothetical protein [Rugamonas sp.]
MILDEASSLFSASTSNNYLLQFELVKSLVNEIKCRILMCGAYDLLKIEDFNGQLIRRTRIVHFERYHQSELVTGNKYGNAFKDVVASFFDAMPVPVEKGLVNNYEYFLLMSLGCVGNLKDWLIRAVEAALLMPTQILTKAVLISTQMPKKHLLKMLREIRLGEEKMQDISTSILAEEMGFSSTPTLTSQSKRSSIPKNEEKKDRPRKTTPGRRNPSRDPVGREDA